MDSKESHVGLMLFFSLEKKRMGGKKKKGFTREG